LRYWPLATRFQDSRCVRRLAAPIDSGLWPRPNWTQLNWMVRSPPELPWEGRLHRSLGNDEHDGRLYRFYAVKLNNNEPQQIGRGGERRRRPFHPAFRQAVSRVWAARLVELERIGPSLLVPQTTTPARIFLSGQKTTAAHLVPLHAPDRFGPTASRILAPERRSESLTPRAGGKARHWRGPGTTITGVSLPGLRVDSGFSRAMDCWSPRYGRSHEVEAAPYSNASRPPERYQFICEEMIR
jgi:hypothetical protein